MWHTQPEVTVCVRYARFHHTLRNSVEKFFSWNLYNKYFTKLKILTWHSKRGWGGWGCPYLKDRTGVSGVHWGPCEIALLSVSRALVKGAGAQMAKQVWKCHHRVHSPSPSNITLVCFHFQHLASDHFLVCLSFSVLDRDMKNINMPLTPKLSSEWSWAHNIVMWWIN